MFIRPRRYRTIFTFLAGLGVSVALLTGGYFYYRANIAGIESELRTRIGEEVAKAFDESHPMSIVYVFSKDKQAGEIVADSDLMPAEIGVGAIPADAVLSPEAALGKAMRCNVAKNTVATASLLFSSEDYPDDLRLMEYTVVILPRKLDVGNFVDVRIMFPNGLDYIVLTKKEVIDRVNGENGQSSIIWMHMNEEEILRMSSAIVDAGMVDGSKLYAVTYVAPDIQDEAHKTYPVNNEVLELILSDPNIVEKAVETLEARIRAEFEEQMNRKLEFSGKHKVFDTGDGTVPADSASGIDSSSDKTAEVEDPGIDGRL